MRNQEPIMEDIIVGFSEAGSDEPVHWTEHYAYIGPQNGKTRYVVLVEDTDSKRKEEAAKHCQSGEIIHSIDSRHRCSEKGSCV